jgi:hypothetical protein
MGSGSGVGDQRRGQDTDGLAIGEDPEGGGADQYFLPRTGGAVKDGEQLCAVTVAVQDPAQRGGHGVQSGLASSASRASASSVGV